MVDIDREHVSEMLVDASLHVLAISSPTELVFRANSEASV